MCSSDLAARTRIEQLEGAITEVAPGLERAGEVLSALAAREGAAPKDLRNFGHVLGAVARRLREAAGNTAPLQVEPVKPADAA